MVRVEVVVTVVVIDGEIEMLLVAVAVNNCDGDTGAEVGALTIVVVLELSQWLS